MTVFSELRFYFYARMFYRNFIGYFIFTCLLSTCSCQLSKYINFVLHIAILINYFAYDWNSIRIID